MKNSIKSIICLAIILFATTFTACKKDKTLILPDEALALLPKQFADELFKNGFDFYTGNNPAIIDNIYLFQPINDFDNSGYFKKGESASNAKIKIANQLGQNADIFIYNWVLGKYDTSIANIIIGDGNKITAIAQAQGISDNITYKYDYVFTGVLTSSGLANIKFAFVMVDNPGAVGISKTGTIRMFHDRDKLAEFTNTFRTGNTIQSSENTSLKNMFSL